MADTTTRFYILDANGNRQSGLGTIQGLRKLAGEGKIQRDTPLESESGHRGTAGDILDDSDFPNTDAIDKTSDGKVKNALTLVVFTTITIGVVVCFYKFAPPISFFSSGDPPHLIALKKAKSGDSVKYDISASVAGDTQKMSVAYRVISNDGKKIRFRVTTTTPWGPEETDEVEYDFSKSEEENSMSILKQTLEKQRREMLKQRREMQIQQGRRFPRGNIPQEEFMESIEIMEGLEFVESFMENMESVMKNIDVKSETGKTSRGTISVAGRSFNCVITPYTYAIAVGNITLSVRDIKVWYSKGVPVTGTVKLEWETTVPTPKGIATLSVTTTLTEFVETK